MSESQTGGCLCGAVRYQISGPALMAGHCHCRTCQRAAGGPMKTVVGFPLAAFKKAQGMTREYTYRADSGHRVTNSFCPECGSQLFGRPEKMQGLIFVSATSLDDASWVHPALHIYMSKAQPWDPTQDNLPHFAAMPPSET